MLSNNNAYRFGNFSLIIGEHCLKRGEREIHLRPKTFQTLYFLVKHHGHLVKKNELLNAVWENEFVTENTLTKCIGELRLALKDKPKQPRFIKTIPGIGFKFIAEVNKTAPDSLAVLPFSNLTGDPGQDYFADGMTEALISDLAVQGVIKVISRTSVMAYKKVLKPLPQIARELNVELIVEGSVQRNNDHLRIIAQLIHAQTDLHRWVRTYERDISDIHSLQRELAQEIALEIRSELNPGHGDDQQDAT